MKKGQRRHTREAPPPRRAALTTGPQSAGYMLPAFLKILAGACLPLLCLPSPARAAETPVTNYPLVIQAAPPSPRCKATIRKLKSANRQLRKNISRLRARIRTLNKQQAALNKELSKAKRLSADNRREADIFNTRCGRLEESLQRSYAALAALSNENASLKRKIAALQSDLDEARRRQPSPPASPPPTTTSTRQPSTTTIAMRAAPHRSATPILEMRSRPIRLTAPATHPPNPAAEKNPAPPTTTNKPPAPAPETMPPPASPPATSAFELVARGNRRLARKDLTAAEADFKQALSLDDTLIGARLGLAACAYARGDYSEADTRLNKILVADPGHPRALALAALLAWRRGALSKATDLIRRAIAGDDSDPQLHNYAGIIAFARGQTTTAISEFKRAVELNPELADAHFNLAVLLCDDDPRHMAQARREYQLALRYGSHPDKQLERRLQATGP